MAWNEPGGNNDKDPWGNDQGPPDLDEAFRKFKEKFAGGNKGGAGSSGGSGGDMPEISGAFLGVILAVVIAIWGAFGVYTVDEQEKAVVLRFGKFYETEGAGLHWNPPLVDLVEKVNVSKVRSVNTRGLMLTQDDNIVEISLSVQYTVSDPANFLLKVRQPEISLRHAAESALRHVIGSSTLDDILTSGRDVLAIEMLDRLQTYLTNYETGIDIATVNFEDAQPPQEVSEAFADVQRAKEDEQREKNQAETYKNGIIPEARGYAQRQIEEANGYKEQVIAKAEGEAERFTQLLVEYEKAPKVTRQRLYIDTLERVMSNSSKVMIDVDGGNLLYLPLDKLMGDNFDGANSSSLGDRFMDTSESGNRRERSSGRSSSRSSNREGR